MSYTLSPAAQAIYDNKINNFNPIPTNEVNHNLPFGTFPLLVNLKPAFLCAKVTATAIEIAITPTILADRIDALTDKMLKVFDFCATNSSLQLGVLSQIQVQNINTFDLSQAAAVYMFALTSIDASTLNAQFGGLELFVHDGDIGSIDPWNALVI
jgi:hypothetical protein